MTYENFDIKHMLPQMILGFVLKSSIDCKGNEEKQKCCCLYEKFFSKHFWSTLNHICTTRIALCACIMHHVVMVYRASLVQNHKIFFKNLSEIDPEKDTAVNSWIFAFGCRSHLWDIGMYREYSQMFSIILGPGSHIALFLNFDDFHTTDTPETMSFFLLVGSKSALFLIEYSKSEDLVDFRALNL